MDYYIEEITEIHLGHIPMKVYVYENLVPETLYMLNLVAARYFRRDKVWYKNPITAFEKAYKSVSINVMNIILSNENDMRLGFYPVDISYYDLYDDVCNVECINFWCEFWEYVIRNNNEKHVNSGHTCVSTFEKIMRKIGCEKIMGRYNSYYYVKNIK